MVEKLGPGIVLVLVLEFGVLEYWSVARFPPFHHSITPFPLRV
jgi:hypothetical protein